MIRYNIINYKIHNFSVMYFYNNNIYITWSDVLNYWKTKNKHFNSLIRSGLLSIPYKFMLKFIPLTYYSLDKPFIIIAIYSDELPINQNYTQYEKYFKFNDIKYTVDFWNLDNKTYLLCPYPKCYKNFATIRDFLLNSSNTQLLEFWKKTSLLAYYFLSLDKPIYINTHGKGVSYLHLRFDKIYKHNYNLPYPLNNYEKITLSNINIWYKFLMKQK